MKISELESLAQRSRDPSLLSELAGHANRRVRATVAENEAASDDTICLLLEDPDAMVRLAAAAENLRARPDLQLIAARSADEDVRATLASTFLSELGRSLQASVQAILAGDPSPEVRGRIAATTDQPNLFEALLRDDAHIVRAYCASNPRINRSQMNQLVTDGRAGVRAAAAGNGLRYPDDDELVRLSNDRSASVRWAVLFRVDRPRAALERISHDVDDWNREHAQRALLDESLINGPEAVGAVRKLRAQADSLGEFPQVAP